MKTIIQSFEKTVNTFPDKTAVNDEISSLSYTELRDSAKRIGTSLAVSGKRKGAVALYLKKTPVCAAAMLGTAYSGNFYVVIDTAMPVERIKSIFATVKPFAVIYEEELSESLNDIGFEGLSLTSAEALSAEADDKLLSEIQCKMTSTDLLYCLFTSGSTGVPKGTAVTHGNVLSYTDWFINTFDITSETIFGSQTPFYFSMSVTDFYSSLRTGAQLAIIPKKYFAFPVKLVQYMNEKKVNTIYWVPSALCIAANMDLFKYMKPEYLHTVLFAGEVMPVKKLNYWISYYPDVKYANLFGPTETTDICTYYTVDRSFEDSEALPIGAACDNCSVAVISEDGKECAPGEEGELYVGGPFVAAGYYNNPEKTAEAFVLNPLQSAYPEIVYKTGDIVKYNDRGELLYCGRKDFQIKHMGYRIELGEIENAALAEEGLKSCACLFDKINDKIIIVYEGSLSEDELLSALKKRVPDYMMPAVYKKLAAMPHNSNGKIDRALLKKEYCPQ